MPSVDELEKEVDRLHNELEMRGANSRGVKDIFGRTFPFPVNSEHKATVFFPILWTVKKPHMRTFWAATAGFFCTFFSCFAPGAIGSYIKRPAPEGLGLSKLELSDAGNYAVTGTILMRIITGPMCDKIGARKTFIFLLLLGVPGMIMMIFAQSSGVYLWARVLIGLSLATFVTCQVWCSQFFDRKVVGTANATAGGWGNVGGGFTLLLMPQLMKGLLDANAGNPDQISLSWRQCFILPIVMHLASAFFIWTGSDLPDGSYKDLETSGAKQKSKSAANVALIGFTNLNAWILLIGYAFCFGVELTMNNKLVNYFERYYAIPNQTAGPLGASFSLMNLFARSWGGILSDYMATKKGLPGRISAMWVCQVFEGIFCIVLGLITQQYDSPDEIKFHGAPLVNSTWSDAYGQEFLFTQSALGVSPCESDLVRSPSHGWMNGVWTMVPVPVNTLIVVKDPAPTCVHAQGTLPATLVCVILFSIFVQMSEGLHFGIVPYVSRPALGVVSGMVGAGGNAGALIAGKFIVGAGNNGPLDDGFIRLGAFIIGFAMLFFFIYFPESGGMVLPKGLKYDPQLVKPAADQKGSDELDFTNTKSTETVTSSV